MNWKKEKMMSEQTKALTKADTFGAHLHKLMPAIKAVLPKHLTPDRFLKILRVYASQMPLIYECTSQSVNECVMVLAELGVDVSKARQHAALIPFRNKKKNIIELQVQMMYKGLIDIALRDGRIVSIEAHVVHKNDTFKCRFGSDPILEHSPRWEGDPGETIAAYAIAKLLGGTTQWEVMTRAELDKVQRSSQDTRPDAAWRNWPDQMRRKTVIKRLCKYLPASPSLAQAIDLDNEQGGIIDTDYTVIEPPKLTAGRHDAKKKPAPAPEAAQPPQEPSEQPTTTKAPEHPPEATEAPPRRKRGRPRKKPEPEPTPEPEPQPEPEAPGELTKQQMIDEIQEAIDEDQIPFPTVKVICDEIGIDAHELKAASAEHMKALHEQTVGVMMGDDG